MNNSMLLTKEEKERFIKWLEYRAIYSNSVLAHIKKLNVPQLVLVREQQMADAYHLVAEQLANSDMETIGK